MKIIKFTLLIAILSLFGIGVFAEKINIEKLNYDLGMQSLKQNDLQEAVKYFNLVIDKNPFNTEAHYNLAIAYKKLGQHENALKHFNIVVKLLNSPQEDESELVNIAKLRQKSNENFDIYTQVKSKENDYIDLGDMHVDNNQYKAAIEYYNLALQINPYNDNTYYKVSKCYVELNDYNNAEPYIRRAVELDTDNSRYNYYQDIVLQNVDSNKKIVLQNFNKIDPLKDFEDNYYEKELYQEALPEKTRITQYYKDEKNKEILQKLSQQGNSDFSNKQSQELDYIDLADLHFDNQEYDRAIEYYKMALNINPNNDYTYYKLSRCNIELGNYKQADQYIEKAMSLAGKNNKYVYFKNKIADRISGKPFGDNLEEYIPTADNSFYTDQIASEQPPAYYQQGSRSFFEKAKSAIKSIKKPKISLKMPDMPNIKVPTLEGKVEKEGQNLDQENSIFNRDLKRYEITEKIPPYSDRQPGEYGQGTEQRNEQFVTEDYNQKGIEFFKANNLQKAEDYFKKAVQLRPMDPRAYNNLANVEFKRGNYEKAKEYALQSVAIDPQFPQGYYNLGLISRKQKDFAGEIEYLNRAIAADQKYYEAYFARGVAYYNHGDNEKAKYNFTEVLNLKNDHYLASQNLGIIYANELNYTEAEKHLQQAVRLNRNNSQSYFYLGFAQQNLGKTVKAIENYQRSIDLDPFNYKTYVALSKTYDADGQPEKALETLKAATYKNSSNAEIYNYLGLMSLKFEKYEEACEAFAQAAKKDSKRPIYFYNLSQCYLTLGKRKESNIAFQQAVNIIPEEAQDYIDLAEIFFDRGMTSYAIENLKTGISQVKENDYLYLVLADFYERTGAKESARETLEKYLKKKVTEESTFSLLVRKRLNELQ